MAEAEELPKTIVRRVVKEKLSTCSDDGDIAVHKDALLAFSESAKIFIHYLSATANDICKESKRQIINAEDVLKALEETEFTEFVNPLKDSLEEFRKKNAGKKARVSKGKGDEKGKKRKLEGELSDKGEPSEKGDKGEPSEKGDKGEPSEKGDKGEPSEKGDQGEQSEKGDQGEPSEKGDQGEPSEKGEQGEPSEKGEQGDDDDLWH